MNTLILLLATFISATCYARQFAPNPNYDYGRDFEKFSSPIRRKLEFKSFVQHAIGEQSRLANEGFLNCCKGEGLDTACEPVCNFDVLTKSTLMEMAVGMNECPLQSGEAMMHCAAQNKDHTACCRAAGVARTSAGAKCLDLCNMTPGLKLKMDHSMAACLTVLDNIKKCFIDGYQTEN